MLISRWEPHVRQHEDRLVLELPAQAHGKLLVMLVLWLVFWPVGALVLPTTVIPWIAAPLLRVAVMLLLGRSCG